MMIRTTDVAKVLKRTPRLFDLAARARRPFLPSPIYDCIDDLSRTHRDVRFLQIGANDGMSGDVLREFVVRCRTWRGAFVEPVPQIFGQLRTNYAYLRRPALRFLNCAVSDTPGTKPFWKIRDECLKEFALFANLIGSFDRGHIVKHFPAIDAWQLECIEVPCRRYEDVLGDADLDEVDLLMLDVEGHEAAVLGSIPFDRSAPGMIIFETSHMSDDIRAATMAMLRARGYSLEQQAIDCIARIRQ